MNRFSYQCQLRWSDMDANQHVNNGAFCRYLEEARVRMLISPMTAEHGHVPTETLIVSQQTVRYLSPLFHRLEPVTVETWTTRVQSFSCDLAGEVKDGDRTYAAALTTIVGYDLGTGRLRQLRPAEIDRLDHYRGDLPRHFMPGAVHGPGPGSTRSPVSEPPTPGES